MPSPRLVTHGRVVGRHLWFLPPTSHPQFLSSVLRLVQALALGHSLNPPRGDLSSVTLATAPPPSFLDPRSPDLRRSLPLDLLCDPTILLTERKSRREIGTPILEITSVPLGKRHLPSPLLSTFFQIAARKIPTSMTSSVDHRIPRLPSQ